MELAHPGDDGLVALLVDFGAEKCPPYADFPINRNPSLGLRGIRLLLDENPARPAVETNHTRNLFEDARGGLLIGTEGDGLKRYDFAKVLARNPGFMEPMGSAQLKKAA